MPYGSLLADVVQSSVANTPPQFNDTNGVQTGTLCRAWVSFVGSTAAIRGAFNVSSVTRGGAGDYTVNFTTAMPDANYATTNVAVLSGYINAFSGNSYSRTTTSTRLGYFYQNSGSGGAAWSTADPQEVNVAIFR